MKTILMTGGGTAGHVTPNIALFPQLKQSGYQILYVGSYKGIERELIKTERIPYYAVSSGKLRRYLDLQNVTDAFRVVRGLFDAVALVGKLKPDVIFSKGGFVAVPVVIAGRLRGVPVVLHESDMTPGLANRLCLPFARQVCVTFPETAAHVGAKAVCTGTPIRRQLFQGRREKGLALCGFTERKPVILVMGGSLGAQKINQVVRKALPGLAKSYQIIHICGRGNVDDALTQQGYKQFEYVSAPLPDLFAAAALVVSRAGANSICEFLALAKPNLLIPLSKAASRGDQILNAESFAKRGYSKVLYEEELTEEALTAGIIDLYNERERYVAAMKADNQNDAVDQILRVIDRCANGLS